MTWYPVSWSLSQRFGTALLQILAAALITCAAFAEFAKHGITHVGPSYWLTSSSAALAVAPKAHAMARIAAAQDFIVAFILGKMPISTATQPNMKKESQCE